MPRAGRATTDDENELLQALATPVKGAQAMKRPNLDNFTGGVARSCGER